MKFLDAVVIKAKHRTCNQCGASWFVDKYLENRAKIQGVAGDFSSVASSGVTRMAAINAANSAEKGLQNECPSCGSKDYSETTVLHTGTKHPNVPQSVGLCPLCRKPIDIEAKKCPNCTGDISEESSRKLKEAHISAEKEFLDNQEKLTERLFFQKKVMRGKNLFIGLGMLVMLAIMIGSLAIVEQTESPGVLYAVLIVPVLYLIGIFVVSGIAKKKLVRFAISQEKAA